MRKFLYKTAVLLLLIGASFVSAAMLCRAVHKKVNPYEGLTTDGVAHFFCVPHGIKVCNLGSSHGLYGFYWEKFPAVNGYNLAMWSQRFQIDYAVLKQFHKKLEKGAVVILPISYFDVYQYEVQGEDYRQHFYCFINPFLMQGANIAEWFKYALLPYFSLFAKDIKTFAAHGEKKPFPDLQAGRTDYPTKDKLKESALNIYKGWTEKSGSEEEYKKNFKYACKIIDFCHKKSFVPVLVSTPIAKELNSMYDEKWPEFWDIFYRFTRELCQKYPGLQYFDYSHDDAFLSDELHLFADASHLNSYGAMKLTATVLQDLKAAGISIPQ